MWHQVHRCPRFYQDTTDPSSVEDMKFTGMNMSVWMCCRTSEYTLFVFSGQYKSRRFLLTECREELIQQYGDTVVFFMPSVHATAVVRLDET